MVFSVAVGYIKHPAMTCITREPLRFPHLSRREPVARMLAPSSRDLHTHGSRVGQVCRTCVRTERERVNEIQGRPSIGEDQLSSLPCSVTCSQGFHPFQRPAHHTCSLPAWAQTQPNGRLPGVCKLWPAGAEHCRFHLTRARGAAPLGGSSSSCSRSSSRRRPLSPWDLCGCVGCQWDHGGAWQGQASSQLWQLGSVLWDPMGWRGCGGAPALPGALGYLGLTLAEPL